MTREDAYRFLSGLTAVVCVVLAMAAGSAFAACQGRWVDHDHDLRTAPIYKQLCDSVYDIPDYRNPGIPPIQQPQIKPLPSYQLPPLGTQRCATESVYNAYTGRWENKRVCY